MTMKPRLLATLAATMVSVTAAAGTASLDRPRFSGTWISDTQEVVRIAQDAAQLTVTTPGPRGERTLLYRLDGSDSRNETTTAAGETWTHVSRAEWLGPAIAIRTTTTRAGNGKSWTWMTRYFFAADQTLTVATLDGVLTSAEEMALKTVSYRRQ